MRAKHRRDYNNGKNGWVSGNPRYSGKGFHRGDRAPDRTQFRRSVMQQQSFEQWKQQVDREIASRCGGMTADDLPDVDYRGLYNSGDCPRDAATFTIRNAMDLDTNSLDDPFESDPRDGSGVHDENPQTEPDPNTP